jgi:2-polyprenyl-3-methyl-5-hydroxy-6-metoxy-1,4-benzoquinol methylase
MDSYQETFETWNKLASLYQEKFMNLDLYNDSYNLICNSIVKKNAKILEIGCGPGNITKYLLSKKPDWDILGIDIATNMIALAKENNSMARFAVMDAREIDQIKETFDAIICGFCLPYLSHADARKFITDCSHLLNEEALFYLSFVEGNPDKSDFVVGLTGDRCYFYFHQLHELKALLLENKFDEPKVFKVKYNKSETELEIHTILITKKKTTVL